MGSKDDSGLDQHAGNSHEDGALGVIIMVVVAVLFSVWALVGQVSLAEVQVSWSQVDLDVKGNPKTISHYLLYYGRHPRPKTVRHPADVSFRYENVINIGQVLDYRIRAIEKGYHWYFSVAAVDREGSLSNYSDEVRLPIPDEDGQIKPTEITTAPRTAAAESPTTQSTQHCASINNPMQMLLPILLVVLLVSRYNALKRKMNQG